MLHRTVAMAIVGICAAYILSGCNSLPGTGQAQAAVCQAIAPISTAVEELSNIEPNATGAEVKALVTRLEAPIQTVREGSERLNVAALDELYTSYDSLKDRVDELSDDATLDTVAGEIQTATATVQSALDKIGRALNCDQ